MLIGDFGGILQLILIIFKIGFTFDSFIVLFFYRVLLYCRDRQKIQRALPLLSFFQIICFYDFYHIFDPPLCVSRFLNFHVLILNHTLFCLF